MASLPGGARARAPSSPKRTDREPRISMEKSTDLKARVSVGASFSPFRFGPVTVTVRLLHTTVTATEGRG